MLKNCQLVFQHFSFGHYEKKVAYLNELNFWEASRNHESSLSWKFHKSILKNAKTSQLSASIFDKVVPLYIILLIVHKGCHHFFQTCLQLAVLNSETPMKKDVTISKFPLCNNNQMGGESTKNDKHTWWSNRTGQLVLKKLMNA